MDLRWGEIMTSLSGELAWTGLPKFKDKTANTALLMSKFSGRLKSK
jgi:hypothetical protein